MNTETELRAALADWAQDGPALEELRPRLTSRRQTGRMMVGAAAGVAALLIGVSVAVGSSWFSEKADGPAVSATAVPSQPWTGTCFGENDLDTESKGAFMMGSPDPTGTPSASVADGLTTARNICAWHGVGRTWTSNPEPGSDGQIPDADPELELAICVLADGSLGVFGGDETVCGELGLPVAVEQVTTTTG